MLEDKLVFYVDDDADDLEIFSEVASSIGVETKLFNAQSGKTALR